MGTLGKTKHIWDGKEALVIMRCLLGAWRRFRRTVPSSFLISVLVLSWGNGQPLRVFAVQISQNCHGKENIHCAFAIMGLIVLSWILPTEFTFKAYDTKFFHICRSDMHHHFFWKTLKVVSGRCRDISIPNSTSIGIQLVWHGHERILKQ